jgi:hypothetical protein
MEELGGERPFDNSSNDANDTDVFGVFLSAIIDSNKSYDKRQAINITLDLRNLIQKPSDQRKILAMLYTAIIQCADNDDNK